MILLANGLGRCNDKTMTDEKKIWPSPPKQQQVPTGDTDVHIAALRLIGIASVYAAIIGILVSLGTENLYTVMGPKTYIVMRLVSACVLSVALLLGVFGIRVWQGKLGVCLSFFALLSVLQEILEFMLRR